MKKILIVDDDIQITDLIKRILEKRYSVITANSGTKATEMMRSTNLDLVITDMVMPDKDGIQILQLNRKSEKQIPIIIMSGHPVGKKFLDTSSLLGAVGSLSKPFTLESLLLAVEKALIPHGLPGSPRRRIRKIGR